MSLTNPNMSNEGKVKQTKNFENQQEMTPELYDKFSDKVQEKIRQKVKEAEEQQQKHKETKIMNRKKILDIRRESLKDKYDKFSEEKYTEADFKKLVEYLLGDDHEQVLRGVYGIARLLEEGSKPPFTILLYD